MRGLPQYPGTAMTAPTSRDHNMLRNQNTGPYRLLQRSVIGAIIICLVGCSGFLRPHRVPIQQGNIVTKDMLDKLKVGMSPKQVRYILGTPLVVDTFTSDQWHYLYSLRLADGRTLQQKLSLDFTAGKLASFDTDYKFPDAPADNSTTTGDTPQANAAPDPAVAK